MSGKRAAVWMRRDVVVYVVLAMLAFGVYLNALLNNFTFDDEQIILANKTIDRLQQVPSLFYRDYWMKKDTNLYRPFTMLTLALNHAVSGHAPWSYHLVNNILHVLNVMFLYALLRVMYRQRTAIPFLAAAIFAVHPAATEAVDGIVGRAELLACAFALGAFLLYLRRSRGRGILYSSYTLYCLGLLSKENVLVFPILLLIYYSYFEGDDIRSFFRRSIGYVAVTLVYLAVRYQVLGTFGPQGTMQFFYGVDRVSTIYTMIRAVARYWKILFWPTKLQAYYDFTNIPVASSLFAPGVFASLSICLVVLLFAFVIKKKNGLLSFFLFWPFVCLLPVMNILVPTGVLMAIRLLYLPLAGYSVILATGLYGLARYCEQLMPDVPREKHTALLPVVAGCCLLPLSFGTIYRNADWRNNDTLFTKEVGLSPKSFLALKNLGILRSDAGRLDEAEELLRRAIRTAPLKADGYENLGVVLYRKRELTAALEMGRQAIMLKPDSPVALNLVGNILRDSGDLRGAIVTFEAAVAIAPQDCETLYNLADAYEKTDRIRAITAWRSYLKVAAGLPTEEKWVQNASLRLSSLLASMERTK